MTYPLDLITYGWLKAHGWRELQQMEGQPTIHYRRCIGRELIGDKFLQSNEDVCIDVCPDRMNDTRFWYVWLTRASSQNHHPSVWIHTRNMYHTGELMLLYEALSGRPFAVLDWDRKKWPEPLFPTPDPFRR
jgi:hypothetical protein